MIKKKIRKTVERVNEGVKATTYAEWVNGEGHKVGTTNWEILESREVIEELLNVDAKDQINGYKKQIRDHQKQIYKYEKEVADIVETRSYKIWKKRLESGEFKEYEMIMQMKHDGRDIGKYFDIIDKKKYEKYKLERKSEDWVKNLEATQTTGKIGKLKSALELLHAKYDESLQFSQQMKDALKLFSDI